MSKPSHPRSQPAMRATTLRSSFRYAFAGLWHLVSSQRNAQIHLGFTALATGCGLFFQISRGEWLILVLTFAMVLAAEGWNTAIEAVVDLASPDIHPLAKVAKDVAAGTVLLTAMAAVIIGLGLFVPYAWVWARWLLGW